MSFNAPRRMIIISPATTGGSWVFLHHVISKMPERYSLTVVTLGRVEAAYRQDCVKYVEIPFASYEKHGISIAQRPVLNFLFEIPLILVSCLLIAVYRPHIIMPNGFMAALGIIPFAKLVRSRIIVSHRGFLKGGIGPFRSTILRRMAKCFDLILVNSEGSKKDVIEFLDSAVFDGSRIGVVSHIAEETFFEGVDRSKLREKFGFSGKFVLLYVGRIDHEKRADLLIKAVPHFGNDPSILFVFVGPGNMTHEVEDLCATLTNVKFLGRITEREKLRDLYAASDVLWSYSDDTYLGRPAVEGLSTGTPIIIPDEVALLLKRVRVPKSLIPSEIGWIVPTNVGEIVSRIRQISTDRITESMRDSCKSFAVRNYSPRNLAIVFEKIDTLA